MTTDRRRRKPGRGTGAARLEKAARKGISETLDRARVARRAVASRPAGAAAPAGDRPELAPPPFVARRIETWPIDRVKGLARNPRVHSDQQVDEIAASISRFGFLVPLVVHKKERRVLAGNGRLAAALRLGMKAVPVLVVDHLSPALRQAYVVADNQIALHASWDDAILAEYFQSIERAGLDPTITFYSAEEIEEIVAAQGVEEHEPEEAVPPLPKRATSKRGDLWLVGNHRVYCGDATVLEDVQALVGEGGRVDCVWTDPPYGVSYSGAAGRGDRDELRSDDLPERELGAMLLAAFTAAAAVMSPGSPIYVAHAHTMGHVFARAFLDAGFHLASCLVWRKGSLVVSRGDYHWQHEPLLYGWLPGAPHRWYGGRGMTSIAEFDEPVFRELEDDCWQITLGETSLVIRGAGVTVEQVRGTVFLEGRPSTSKLHPTMKPVPLIERMLACSARPGHRVLDLFGGAGSTLVACENRGLQARVLELEPRYVDVIVQRWQDLTGKKATIASTGRSFDEVVARRKRNE